MIDMVKFVCGERSVELDGDEFGAVLFVDEILFGGGLVFDDEWEEWVGGLREVFEVDSGRFRRLLMILGVIRKNVGVSTVR